MAGTERLVNVNVGPTWSRDGEHLAYYSFRNWFDSNATRLTAASIRLLVIRSRKTGEERTVPLPPRVAFSVWRCILTEGSSSSTPPLKNRRRKSGRWRIS